MRDVVDPELGINVVDLGLVYGIAVDSRVATIDMTLTSAACPLTDVIEDQARAALVSGGLVDDITHQLGVDAAVGSGEDHRRRPRAAAGARLPRLTRGGALACAVAAGPSVPVPPAPAQGAGTAAFSRSAGRSAGPTRRRRSRQPARPKRAFMAATVAARSSRPVR